MEIIFSVFIFILGVCIGSFLNCVVYRIEEGKSFLKGRSFCPNCKHGLNWKDLFPVFSYVYLRGKCRYCKAKISAQYPVVEILTGVIFLLISNFEFRISNQIGIFEMLNLIFLFYVVSVLIVIFIYDLKHYLIPDNVLFPAIGVAIVYRIFELISNEPYGESPMAQIKFQISNSATNYLLAVIIGSGFFFVIWFVSRGKWMGFGDVKLGILLGLVLGFPNILVAMFLAFLFGAIIGVGLMLCEKKNAKSEIPFGPFLIFGTFIALLWGTELIRWYTSLFQI